MPEVKGQTVDTIMAGRTLRASAIGFLVIAALIIALRPGGVAEASGTSVNLMAGQHTIAGTVSTEIVGTNLVVTYSTAAGWLLDETHLWVGKSLSTMPVNKAGNPQIGQFPYSNSNLNGATSQVVTIPLSTLNAACGDTLFAAAHAAMRQVDGNGTTLRTETGWGAGSQIRPKGSWATYFSFTVNCPPPPPPPPSVETCETAWAFGQQTFDELDIATRWGWVISVNGATTVPIYAAAGGNNLAAGYLVGSLTVTPGINSTTVTFNMAPGYSMDATHLYVGTTMPTTAAPGQLGAQHVLTDASTDTFTVNVSGSTLYVAAHAVVCSTNWQH